MAVDVSAVALERGAAHAGRYGWILAAGLTSAVAIQTFIIIGGVTRMIPLTGITLPFVSYGGSSLVANFVILALLLRISDDNARALVGGVRRGRAATAVAP